MVFSRAFIKSQMVLSFALLMIFAAGIGPALASDIYQESTRPSDLPLVAFDSTLVNEYMDECQSIAAGDCLRYGFEMAGSNTLAAAAIRSAESTPVALVDSAMINQYMAEGESVLEGSVIECLDYAFAFAATTAK